MSKHRSEDYYIDPENEGFWRTVEEFSAEVVPPYLKKLIVAAGYDRYTALKHFLDPVSDLVSDDTRYELEKFARQNIPALFSEEFIEQTVYLRNPETFQLVPGHIQLLKSIAQKLPPEQKVFDKVSIIQCYAFTESFTKPERIDSDFQLDKRNSYIT